MKKNIPLHPFLFALYPILFLYSHNIDRVSLSDIYRVLTIQEAGAIVFLLLVWLLCRNWHRASLVTSFTIILFSSFGHLYSYLSGTALQNSVLRQANVLAAIWAALFILINWWFLRKLANPQVITTLLNSTSAFLILFPLMSIASFVFVNMTSNSAAQKSIGYGKTSANQQTPDIYYIILDEYGRPDTLNKYLSFDDSEFVSFLKSRGFYLPENAHSNYPITALSISSTLNYQYLDRYPSLSPEVQKKVTYDMLAKIKKNEAMEFLRQRGYKIITFATAYVFIDIPDVDLFVTPQNYINNFEADYLNSTLFILNMRPVYSNQWRALINEPFQRLPDLMRTYEDTPKLVYMHLPAAHPPFVFGPNGESVEPRGFDEVSNQSRETAGNYEKDYRDQALYVNKLVEKAVDTILANSKMKPIIVIQGDHGTRKGWDWSSLEKTCVEERLSILNAYYLPGMDYTKISRSITPVNTFRLIFNQYFGANLEMLDNKVYYSSIYSPFNLYDVTDRLSSCK